MVKVGEAEKKLGANEKEFIQKSSDCFLQPLKSFLEGQMKIIQVDLFGQKSQLWTLLLNMFLLKKEKKTLEIKRLDLDACKARLKKLNEASPQKLDVSYQINVLFLNIFCFLNENRLEIFTF